MLRLQTPALVLLPEACPCPLTPLCLLKQSTRSAWSFQRQHQPMTDCGKRRRVQHPCRGWATQRPTCRVPCRVRLGLPSIGFRSPRFPMDAHLKICSGEHDLRQSQYTVPCKHLFLPLCLFPHATCPFHMPNPLSWAIRLYKPDLYPSLFFPHPPCLTL